MLAEEKPSLISTEQAGSTDSTEQADLPNSTDSTDIDSSSISSQWDRSSLAKLVGLNDDDDPDTVSSAGDSLGALSSSEPYSGDNNSDVDSTEGNVLGDDELFDDPHLKATPKSVAKSPFAKFGLVGGGLGAVFLLAGLLLSGIMNAKGPVKAKVSTPTPTPTVDAKKPQNTEGQLKTEIALNSQSNDLKQLDEAKKNQKKQGVSPTDPKGQKTANGKVTSATPTTAAATTSASSTPSTVYSGSPPPSRVSSPPVTSSPTYRASSPPSSPSSFLKPKDSFSQVAASMPSAPKPLGTPASTTPTATTVSSTNPSQVDPVTQWQALASLGSYSATDSEGQQAPSGANEVAFRDTTQRSFSPASARFTSGRFTQTSPQTSPQTPSSTQPSTPSSTTDDGKLAEQRLLDGTPYRVAATGSMATGVLTTPAILPATSTQSGATNASSQSPPRFVVTLSGDLTDTSGQTLMPAGTSLVFEARGIDGNGVMNAVAVSQIDNTGMEKALPPDALVLTGEKGSPLIAKGYFDNGGTIASMDISSAVLGALGKVGEILNRPTEQTASLVSGGTVSQTTTSTTGQPNLLGAVLEGGASPVLQQIMKRNEQSIQDMQQRKNLWFVKAGTNVQVVVNHSFEL